MWVNRQSSSYWAFSKASDKVSHSKLLWRMHQYGIHRHDIVLNWVRAIPWVVIDGEESKSVTYGVPLELCSGPDSVPNLPTMRSAARYD